MPEENYLDILEQSLKKKLGILIKIRQENEQQRLMLLDENVTPKEFEKNLEAKASLVEQLDLLDEGFEETYVHVRDFLDAHKKAYQEQIQRLQELIRQITAEGSSIQAEEQRNYKLAEKKFVSLKKQIREVKASHKIVTQYYRTMNKTNYINAQFLDNKK